MIPFQELEPIIAELSPSEKAQVLQWILRDLGDLFPGIEKTPGVVGGEARIIRTRIPVWSLVQARRLGMSDTDILLDYPSLRPDDLANAWAYTRLHPKEIEQSILENETA